MSEPERASDHVRTGAAAAKALAGACDLALEKEPSPRLEVVRDLALDLKRQLEGLAPVADGGPPDLIAEAAQRCADLATLAACNAGELATPEKAARAVRLAAAAVESLARPDDHLPDLVERDLNSASWKAALAARQVEEATGRG